MEDRTFKKKIVHKKYNLFHESRWVTYERVFVACPNEKKKKNVLLIRNE